MSYSDLRLIAGMFDDAQSDRIRMENRVRSAADDPTFFDIVLNHYRAAEHELLLGMRAEMRRTASPGIRAWQKEQKGIGESLLARLLGQVGDPRVAEPQRWQGSGEDRVLVDLDPMPRNVAKLWAYCGHGDPARKLRKGISADELYALGNPKAKMLTHLIAEACVKSGVRSTEAGDRYAISHYGDVYLTRRTLTVDRAHAVDCVRCGPSGKPAPAGSTWSKAHQHADALRIIGKEVLKDLWVAAGQDQHDVHVGHASDTHTIATGDHGNNDTHCRDVPGHDLAATAANA